MFIYHYLKIKINAYCKSVVSALIDVCLLNRSILYCTLIIEIVHIAQINTYLLCYMKTDTAHNHIAAEVMNQV